MASEDYKIFLEQLRKRYREGEMSALVGAGFSKNISPEDYPSWKELLSDMVRYLYEQEIDHSYKEDTHFNNLPRNKHARNSYITKKIDNIINRDGYLSIVDQYIEKKGFREAVEIYIEERTPRLESGFVCVGEKKTRINQDNLLLHEKLLRCTWDNLFTTNYDNALEYVAETKSIKREVITNSCDLSFSKQRSPIIKIHGDVMHEGFSFDGLSNKKYVISKRDYETYQNDHEAFTQFMRIALLKGCFCLFGFSGSDPNFISWVKWVRDVLLRDVGNNDKKVFLLSIDDTLPSKEQQLFYDNHKIAYIPLKSDGVKNVLGIAKEEQDIKVIFKAFFKFLEQKSAEQPYYKLWDEVNNATKIGSVSTKLLEKIKEAQKSERFQKYTWRQQSFLQNLYHSSKDYTITAELVELILIAFDDTKYLPSYYPDVKIKVDEFLEQNDYPILKQHWDYLNLRSETLVGNKIDLPDVQTDEFIYENLMRLCFLFEFEEVKTILSTWEPEGRWIQRKAMLVAMFDIDSAKEMLLNYVDEYAGNNDEKYLALQLLNYIDRDYPSKYPTVDFENQNLDNIPSVLKAIRETSNNNNRVLEYGSSSQQLNDDSAKYLSSLRLIQYLIDIGCPISFNSTSMLNNKDWYDIFKHLYVYYPLPCLYYTSQISRFDDQLIKRIGQDFAYNDSMRESVPDLLSLLLKAYDNPLTNNNTKHNLLVVASQLLVSVSPTIWQDYLVKIWDNTIISNFANDHRHHYSGEFQFVESGLQFLPSAKANKILKDCLEHASENKDTAWKIIRHLRLKSDRKIPDGIVSSLDAFIDTMSDTDDIIVICCAKEYLNSIQKAAIIPKIMTIAQESDSQWSLNAIYCSLSFAKPSRELANVIKSIIIKHDQLFHNGINQNNCFIGADRYINFGHIKRNVKYDIKWNKEQAITIYNVLKEKFLRISNSSFLNSDSRMESGIFEINFVPLLTEMKNFLRQNRKNLSNEEDYEATFALVSSLLQREYHFNTIEEALSSDSNTIVYNGVNLLMEQIAEGEISSNENAIQLLVDRMILKRTGSFIYVLSAMYEIVRKNKWDDVKFIENKLLLLLSLYKGSVCVELNLKVPYVYYYLVKIALILKKYGNSPDNEDMNYWLEQMRSKRYNVLKDITE